MGLMMLAAGPGTTITVEATGPEAAQVIEALAALVGGRFSEDRVSGTRAAPSDRHIKKSLYRYCDCRDRLL